MLMLDVKDGEGIFIPPTYLSIVPPCLHIIVVITDISRVNQYNYSAKKQTKKIKKNRRKIEEKQKKNRRKIEEK